MVFRPGKKIINWQEPVETYADELHAGMLIKTSFFQKLVWAVVSAGYAESGRFRKKQEFYLTLRKLEFGNIVGPMLDGWDSFHITSASKVYIVGTTEPRKRR